MEDVWKFRWIVLLQDSYNAWWNFLDEVSSMSLASSWFFTGRTLAVEDKDVPLISPDFDWHIGLALGQLATSLGNASLRESMLLIQLDAGGRKVFVSMRSNVDVFDSGDKRAINWHHFCWALLTRPEPRLLFETAVQQRQQVDRRRS